MQASKRVKQKRNGQLDTSSYHLNQKHEQYFMQAQRSMFLRLLKVKNLSFFLCYDNFAKGICHEVLW